MKKSRSILINAAAVILLAALLAGGIVLANRGEKKEYKPYYTIDYVLVRVEKVLLDNYGYTVVDLGRDVAPETVVTTLNVAFSPTTTVCAVG